MKIVVADITKLKNVEAIVNAANGKGPLGAGVAGAIGYAGGPVLRNEVRRICEARGGYKEGECYISTSGEMAKKGIQHVYHAVTMEYPGSRTSLDIVQRAMRNVLTKAVENGIKTIAFPGLGTGIGALDPKAVALAMVRVAKSFEDHIDITIADIDEVFINFVKEAGEVSNGQTK